MNKSTSIFNYMLPRFQDVFFLAILLAGARYGPDLFNQDGDTGRHITVGNYIIETLSIPTQDVFSHTMQGESLVPHEWLAQISFAFAHRLMGLDGVVFLISMLFAITFTLVYR